MTLANRLAADPALTVRLFTFGPPCLLRAGKHAETIQPTETLGVPKSPDFVFLGEGGAGKSTWREYGSAHVAVTVDVPSAMDASELDGNAPTSADARLGARLDRISDIIDAAETSEDARLAAETPTDAELPPARRAPNGGSVTLPALGETLTQNDLHTRLGITQGTTLANSVKAGSTNALVDESSPRRGRLYTVDAGLVELLESEGYEVEHETSVHECASAGPDEPESPETADTDVQIAPEDAPEAQAERYVALAEADGVEVEVAPRPASVAARLDASPPSGGEAGIDLETLARVEDALGVDVVEITGDGGSEALPEVAETVHLAPPQGPPLSPRLVRAPDGTARIVGPVALDQIEGTLRLLQQETVEAVTRDMRGEPAAAEAHRLNADALLESLDATFEALCVTMETARRYLTA